MMAIIKLKRTIANNPPASLEDGELAAGLGDDPVRMWIGVGGLVKELPFGGNVAVAPTPPLNPKLGQLWWDSSEEGGTLYIWFDNHWVATSPAGRGADITLDDGEY